MMVSEMAERLGTSVSNIKRAFIGTGESLWFHNGKYKNQPGLTRSVLSYYAKHGKTKTVERFPEVNVKCIIDRPEYYGFEKPKRQIRWTDEQIIEAARMAGLISPEAQAKYFNRPHAHAGAVKALWVKRFGFMGGQVNGMVHNRAKHFVDLSARYVRTAGVSRKGKRVPGRRICLWVTMAGSLKPGVPPLIKSAIQTLAGFQRWLWRSDNPKPLILKMIKQRELYQ